MASSLLTTESIGEIVGSELALEEALEIFVDEADAEIIAEYGAHPTDAADPNTALALSRRKGALIDLVRLSMVYSGMQSVSLGEGLSETSFPDYYAERRRVLRRLQTTVRSPYEQESVGYSHFGFVKADEDASAIDFDETDIAKGETATRTWRVSGIPSTGFYRLYWAIPERMAQPSSFTLRAVDITAHVVAGADIKIDARRYKTYLTAATFALLVRGANGQDAVSA